MSETNTRFTKEQISEYGELHNLIPSNNEAMIANCMRLEGMIQEFAIPNTIEHEKVSSSAIGVNVKCNHISDGTVLTSMPPQYRCKLCGEVYPLRSTTE